MELKTQQIEASRLQRLAQDPANVVYEYTHDSPVGVMAPEKQATALRDISASFDYLCRTQATASDEQMRDQVMTGNRHLRLFQQLYPMVFASVTVRATNSEAVARLDKVRKLSMMFVMERWKGEGDEETRHARAMHTAMRLSMRNATDSDRLAPGSTVVAPEDEQALQMSPMSASEFGACTVNQTAGGAEIKH